MLLTGANLDTPTAWRLEAEAMFVFHRFTLPQARMCRRCAPELALCERPAANASARLRPMPEALQLTLANQEPRRN